LALNFAKLVKKNLTVCQFYVKFQTKEDCKRDGIKMAIKTGDRVKIPEESPLEVSGGCSLATIWGSVEIVRIEAPWAIIKPFQCFMITGLAGGKESKITGGEFQISLEEINKIGRVF